MAADFLVEFLALLLQEQGVSNPTQVAEKAAADLRAAKLVDPWALLRAQIQSDPCRDYKVIMRRYHVSRGFVFNTWCIAEPGGESAELRPKGSRSKVA